MIVIQQMCGRIDSKVSNVIGWTITLIMALAGVALIVNLATGQ